MVDTVIYSRKCDPLMALCSRIFMSPSVTPQVSHCISRGFVGFRGFGPHNHHTIVIVSSLLRWGLPKSPYYCMCLCVCLFCLGPGCPYLS